METNKKYGAIGSIPDWKSGDRMYVYSGSASWVAWPRAGGTSLWISIRKIHQLFPFMDHDFGVSLRTLCLVQKFFYFFFGGGGIIL